MNRTFFSSSSVKTSATCKVSFLFKFFFIDYEKIGICSFLFSFFFIFVLSFETFIKSLVAASTFFFESSNQCDTLKYFALSSMEFQ